MGRAFGRLPHELRDAPLHWLVWDYLELREVVRVDALEEEGHRIRAASLGAMGFHAPKMLAAEQRELARRARAFARGDAQRRSDPARDRREAERLIAEMERSGAFADPAPVKA